jgi:hypothetical protein
MTTDTYSTQDFYLSAFLVAKDYPVVAYDRQRNITQFQFEKTSELLLLVQEYFSGKGIINPVRYGNSIKNLKSLIYSISSEHVNDKNNHNLGATR